MLKFVEDLLQGAPVEWKPLGEVFELRNGYTPSKANAGFWTNGIIPWFRMEDIRKNGGSLHDSILHITPQAIKGKGLFPSGSIIMATTATIGEHALLMTDAIANQQFTNFRVRKLLSEALLPKYVYYYFFMLDEWCKKNVNASNLPSVETEKLKLQPFPLPPLPVQEEIVRILDKYTELETELEAALTTELNLRKQQYEYYRNQLLTFGDEVEWKPLCEVATVSKGIQLNKTKLKEEGKYPAYNGGKTYSGWTDSYNVGENTTIISQGGASAGFVNFVTTKFWANAHCYYLIPHDEIIINRYLYHFLKSQEKYFQHNQHGAGIPALAIDKLNQHLIPLPPLPVQEEIVRILDKFDTLVNSLSEGLPKEIALRRKQYEYYRERLLSFPPPPVQ